MLLCPLPAADDWDEVFTARMQLLQVRVSGKQSVLVSYLLMDLLWENVADNGQIVSVTSSSLALMYAVCHAAVGMIHPQAMLCSLLSAGCWQSLACIHSAMLHFLILLSMQARGLMPQLFLSASHLANHQQAAAAAKAGSSSSMRRRSSIIPAAAREVLEVFVMQKRELFADLRAAEQHQDPAAGSQKGAGSTLSSSSRSDSQSIVNDEIQARIEALGMSMAVLTTFVRLLELKLLQMEGEEGTGGALLHCHCYSIT
jgi:hypothetical protein